jgi:ABC-type branched-subunit amino acid transport system ATPase component
LTRPEREFLGGAIRALADSGYGVLLVEHDLDLAIGIADSVAVLEQGQVVFSGLPEGARTDERVTRAFLGAAR